MAFEDEAWRRAYDKREDELRQWPYTLHSIDETLDKDRIEARAKQLLFQALNRRNLVAFVGSGVPIAYGRLSWEEWLSKQTGNIKALGDAFMQCAEASLNLLDAIIVTETATLADSDRDNARKTKIMIDYLRTRRREIDYYKREVQRLKETMDQMCAPDDPFLSKEMPIVFEVASKLQEMLLVTSDLFVDASKQGVPEDRMKFGFNADLPHARAPAEVYDDFVTSISKYNSPEELDDLVQPFKTCWTKLKTQIDDPRTRLNVSEFAKRFLVDECAHAEGLIEKGLIPDDGTDCIDDLPAVVGRIRKEGAGASDSNLQRNINGIREDPDRYWALGYFRTTYYKNLVKERELGSEFAHWTPVIQNITNELEKNAKKKLGIKRGFVSPTRRYTLAMVLKLLFGTADKKKIDECFPVEALKDLAPEPVRQHDFKSRRSLIDDELDPLAKTVITLGIRHYLTTNYDFEIERYFRDRGYTQFSDKKLDHSVEPLEIRRQHHKNYPVDPLGGFLRDDTFDPKRAPELLSFSVDHDNGDAAVYHLHGRADKSSDLVITERDYMNLYLRNDRYRETIDESIRVAFSANPILFLGLGMNEADLLRPFREFMSNRDRALGRTAIALSPGMDNAAKRAQQASTRFVRYGAHTIFYGDAWVRFDKTNGGPRRFHKTDWLHRIMSLLGALESINNDQLKLKRDLDELTTLKEGAKKRETKLNKVTKRATELDAELTRAAQLEELKKRAAELGDRDRLITRLVESLGKVTFDDGGSNEEEIPVLDLLFYREARTREEGGIAIPVIEEGKLKTDFNLRDCLFTSADPNNDDALSKRIGAHKSAMSFECEFIPQLVAVCMTPVPFEGKCKVCQAELEARKIAIEGVKTSILTSTMCIALDELEYERDEWWHLWQAGPPVRFPAFRKRLGESAVGIFSGTIGLPTRFIRHELDNTVTHVEDEPSQAGLNWRAKPDKGCDTGVIPFDTFIDATRARTQLDKSATANARERRLHIVMAHRGAGKGIFTSTLATKRGLANYIKANWWCARQKPQYAAACYINLSFSSEISSTFDMLEKAVWSAAEIVTANGLASNPARTDDESGEELKTLRGNMHGLSRLRRLRAAFRLFCARALRSKRPVRLLVCISAVELMHYHGGVAKNREIESVLRMLTGEESQDWPIDVVLVVDETTVSEVISNDTPFLRSYREVAFESEQKANNDRGEQLLLFVPTVRPDINPRGLQNIMRRMERLNIDFQGMEPEPLAGAPRGAEQKWIDPKRYGSGNVAYVHFARTVKPEHLLVDNYLPLAAVLFFGFADRDDHVTPPEEALRKEDQQEQFKPFKLSPKEKKRIFRASDESSVDCNVPPAAGYREKSDLRDQRVAEAFLRAATRYKGPEPAANGRYSERHPGERKAAEELAELFDEIGKKGDTLPPPNASGEEPDLPEVPNKELVVFARQVLLRRYEVEDELSAKPSRARREWRDIRALLANNRYCLTILLACAQRVALSKNTIKEAYEAAEDFIRSTVDHIKTVSEQKREEIVLSDVLDAYEAFDHVGNPSDDVRLHLCLLRHLAVFAGPCSADVLVQTPEIRHYFENTYIDNDRERRERIIEALTELCERGLVFRLQPHPRLNERYERLKSKEGTEKKIADYYGEDYKPQQEYRYALHRLMQRHVTRKMGSGPRDTSQINSFAPSLFASMPADVPRLNQEAYTFLGSLVASMSQYPDHRAAMPGAENWHYAKAPRSTQIQALRAALGVVRSSFSIATVSRFEDYTQLGEPDASRRGYFEEYRVQVRWLIRKAYELLDRDDTLAIRDYDPYSEHHQHINAFYVDEVVWLYNECGVVNLVQGNLSDAVSLLRQAISINRRVEGLMNGGAHHNRISINLAIAQLERGKLTAARKRLSEICASESQSGPYEGRVWHLAHGYLGLVDHLMGNPDKASQQYAKAIRVLSVYGDTRACATFSRHAGDLERAQKDFKAANRHFENALAFAEAGGHEDVQKRVRLAMIRNEIAEDRHKGTRPQVRQIMAELKMVGDYADTMEMPSLRVDVDHVRAELMINDGETTLAGQLLSRNLTITKRNEMYLRMNGSLIRYAEVLHMRGLNDQANNMLFSSLEMAKRSGSRAEINAVESVFERLHRNRSVAGR